MKTEICAAFAAALLAAASAAAATGTIKTANDQKRGEIKWQRGSKSYDVSYKQGNLVASTVCKLADVVELDIDKPANFDKLADMVRKGQGASAIGGLAKIVEEYRMLQWDKPAGRYLIEAYLSAPTETNIKKAYDVASSIIADDKSAAWTGDLAPAYWKALFMSGKSTQLENCLRKAATSGDRPSSAAALIMRGDMIVSNGGDLPDTYRQALTDAYLRVALMYLDSPCAAQRAEALNKAADCLDKLGFSTRAESMRSKARAL